MILEYAPTAHYKAGWKEWFQGSIILQQCLLSIRPRQSC